tara:strand:+ start:28736 stop:29257 length:522 start_codon:yes stop_codon:yes gene_type:complete
MSKDDVIFDDVPNEKEQVRNEILPPKLNFTKEGLKVQAQTYIESILNSGEDDVLDTYTRVCAILEYATVAKKELTPHVKDEIEKHGKGGTEYNGIKLAVSNSADTHSFDHYDGWVSQKKIVDEETLKLKEIESIMKKAHGTGGVLDDDTGEIIPGSVIKKHGASSPRATIPKS